MRRQMLLRRSAIVVVVAAVVGGSVFLIARGGSSTPTTTTSTTTTTTTPPIPGKDQVLQRAANALAVRDGCKEALPTEATPVNTLKWVKPSQVLTAGVTYYATVKTTAGTFKFKLNTASAPINSNNFAFLAEHNYFHCITFHRVIPAFMDQGGDPTGTGSGGPGYTVSADEYPNKVAANAIQYPKGTVAMANSGAHTNGSQFFVVAKDLTESYLPPNYTIIGTVVSGISTVEKINAEGNPIPADGGVPPYVVNRILSVTITTS